MRLPQKCRCLPAQHLPDDQDLCDRSGSCVHGSSHANAAAEARSSMRSKRYNITREGLCRSTGGYSQQSGSTTFRSATSTSPQKQPPSPAARAASQALSDASLGASTIEPSSPVADALQIMASLDQAAEPEAWNALWTCLNAYHAMHAQKCADENTCCLDALTSNVIQAMV